MLVLEWSRVRRRTVNKLWWVMSLALLAVMTEVWSLNGPNICIAKQKYNITKRVKYRAPMSVRTYEWCLAVPPRCSRYTTEMRDLTRLETEERTAEVAVCCPGYKMKGDFTCVPICPLGKTGTGCAIDCPPDKWGPNCVHDCKKCSDHGKCSPITGECICHTGWQGESCETSISTTTSTTTAKASLLTTSIAELTTSPTETSLPPTTPAQTQTTPISTTKGTTSQAVTKNIRRQDSIAVNAELSSGTVPKVKSSEDTTRDLKYIKMEDSSTRRSDENYYSRTLGSSYSTSLMERIDGEDTNDFVTKKLTTTELVAGKDNDDVSNATNPNKTNPTSEITEIFDKISKTTVYNNSMITPWTFAVTKTLKTVPTAMTTIATTRLQTTESVVLTTTKEIPRKILPFTKVETKTKSTSKESETTKKPEPTRTLTTTAKFKPKEIWIKPAQKGEMKIKSHEVALSKPKHSTVKELPATTTIPRTIIVSIIPTSMSYSTFKKISLTTASAPHTQQYKTSRLMDLRDIIVLDRNAATSTPFKTKIQNSTAPTKHHITTTMAMPTAKLSTLHGSKAPPILTKTTKYLYPEATNSMSMTNEVNKLNYPPSVPTITSTRKEITATSISGTVTTVALPRDKSLPLNTSTVKTDVTTSTLLITKTPKSERNKSANIADKEQNNIVSTGPSLKRNVTSSLSKEKTKISTEAPKKLTTLNVSENISTSRVTNADIQQDEEETFHILTEPEHITAVAGERPSEISTVDLIYVLTIVGGMVMGIITIAVVIVMFERCKRQRYGDIMKMNNIRMQVVIDNNDSPPPPYVRSIFHTPLPEPPMSEKCHYQPISTLDRNLKQFMRPVVVQAISPLMLENFRGILECHYDHLPIRSHDFRASECGRTCCSTTPSVDAYVEPQSSRVNSVTESTIETLKCEADVDEIEASEPLYAEIPCWRPPSAHAVEVVNVNGEAITEL